MEQLKEDDSSFEQRHLEVLNFIDADDQDTLTLEEAVFDEHVNRVEELVERIAQLDIPDKEVRVSHAGWSFSGGVLFMTKWTLCTIIFLEWAH